MHVKLMAADIVVYTITVGGEKLTQRNEKLSRRPIVKETEKPYEPRGGSIIRTTPPGSSPTIETGCVRA